MRPFILALIVTFLPFFSFGTGSAITGDTTVCVGLTDTLTNSVTGGVWSTSAVGIAIIGSSTGIVTGLSAGRATITYIIGSSYVTTTVTVMDTVFPSGCITETYPIGSMRTVPDTFIATVVNGGTAPKYDWFVNNANISPKDTFSYTPSIGDYIVVCILSNAVCASPYQYCTDTLCNAATTNVVSVSTADLIDVYPNPAQDKLTISYHLNTEGCIQIMDVTGRVVNTQALSAGKQNEEIDLSRLAAGVYVYKVTESGIPVYTGKVIKAGQ